LGIYKIASTFPGCLISGIDFSELMYHKASRRNKKFIDKGTVHLQYGDVLTLEPGNDKFDKIFCLNVIYFWNDLNFAFSRIFNMLGQKGEFLIYMDHRDTIEKAKFLADFCKYPIEEVEKALKNAGFSGIEYTFDRGYFISAKKTVISIR
jgi:SAM-dependent methyltransferase